MHINLESDYAVRLVNCLAQSGERMDAQSIAEKAMVPPRFTLKIMQKLGAADIVRSYKGAKGGYVLARDPGEITLCQVIEAVEGPYRFSRCLGDEYDCNCGNTSACRFYGVFDEVTRMVINRLNQVTFAPETSSKEKTR